MGKFYEALKGEGTKIIGEIKQASMNNYFYNAAHYQPWNIADEYKRSGASALSVVTVGGKFGGHLDHLHRVALHNSLPILRKDFITNVEQAVEAYTHGASAVLIIVSLFDRNFSTMAHVIQVAQNLGLDVVLEVHTENQLRIALDWEDIIIGINNRDLATLEVDLGVTERLAPLIPEGRMVISCSGIKTRADIERLQKVGVTRFLVGEGILRSWDIKKATKELIG